MSKLKQLLSKASKYILFAEVCTAFFLGAYLLFFPENLWHVFVRGIGILFIMEGIRAFRKWWAEPTLEVTETQLTEWGNELLSQERAKRKVQDGFPIGEVSHSDIERIK